MVVDGDLTFIEESHTYLLNGVIVPSVSDILHFIFPDKYKGVSEITLSNKARYGTIVHEYIEKFENGKLDNLPDLDIYQQMSIKQYMRIKTKKDIDVLEQEKMIHFEDKYAGRFDMIANIKGKRSLCDIKTTATLDIEYLSWQLSFYEMAYGERFKKLYAIWLPRKELAQLVEIPRKPKKELLKMIRKFEKSKK